MSRPYIKAHFLRDGEWCSALVPFHELSYLARRQVDDEALAKGLDIARPDAPPPGTGDPEGSSAWDNITGKPATFPPTIGATAATAVAGNDARLTDARPPTAHNHDASYEAKNANIQAHVGSTHAPSNAQKNSDITKAEIENKLTGEISTHTHPGGGGGVTMDEVIDALYPVGALYTSTLSTNPGTLLGRGTWAAFGAGRVMVGHNAADADFDTAEETGGAKTHTLSTAEMPSHTHPQNAHTHDFLPRSGTTGSVSSIVTGTLDTSSAIGGANQPHVQPATAVNQNTGGGLAHNNLQPYIVVYVWKRTA